ncbi:porin family protein [Marinospirillum sp.]|uniref:porin family protein n=1 Tax=Marinospirillum sp. TaxID=2183934 RepID=UPI002870745A|nr:porin family protein [Marinospirillum sp.]MDR9468451.1 porin family protein [Marinospirillum sp.]
MKKLIHVPLIVAGLLIVPVGFAAERSDRGLNAYVGGGVGYYRINDDDFLGEDDRLKDNRHALRAYVGVEAGRIFALEGAYTDFGSTSDGLADMELTGLSAAVVVNIPLLAAIGPYGKLGIMSWDRERSFGSLSSNDDGTDLFYGLGVRVPVLPNLDMRVEYERYAIDDTDIDLASVNLQLRF